MKKLSIACVCFLLMGCDATDAIKATKNMPGIMKDMQKQTDEHMTKTNDAIHKQTLVVALDNMLKEENSRYLNPPTGMLPGGETFAKEATAEELAKLTYVFDREIAEIVPEDGVELKDPYGAWTPFAREFDHKKLVKLTALMVIAGLTPQETVEQMVAEQVYGYGRYEEHVYKFLTLRVLFLKSYVIEQSLFAHKLTNPGKFEETLKYLDQIDYIASLPFADRIVIKTTGFLNHDLNIHLVVAGGTDETNVFGSDRTPVGLWEHVARSYETELEQKYFETAEVLGRLNSVKTRIETGLKKWLE